MTKTWKARHRLYAAAAAFLMTGCGIDLQVRRGTVDAGEKAAVTARLKAPAGTAVAFKVTRGEECGKLDAESAAASAAGVATVMYTGAAGVEDCAVTIQADADVLASANPGGTAPSRRLTGSTSFYVNKLPLTKAKIDGVSMLVLFLIASFAVDRTVRGAMFLLSFFAFWRRIVPETGAEDSEKRQRLAYVLMAGALAILALGWLGKVRMLAALGFAQVHPWIDTLFTGLLLVGGADRTEALLRAMGAGQGAEGGKAATPLEIRGRVVLEDSHGMDNKAATAGTPSG